MNENIDLTKILKDCPKGWKFWSPIFGKVEFEQIFKLRGFVNVKKDKESWSFYSDATFPIGDIKSVEIMLYPSEDQRDWSKFATPWYNRKNEQKSTDKIELRFKVGDWVVRGDTIAQILDIQEQYYVGLDINGKDFVSSRFLNGDKIHLWTIQDAKNGDVLVNGSNIFIFRLINNRRLMGYCHVNMDDGHFYNDIGRNECFCMIDAPVTPSTKEQRDLLFQKMKEAGYKWVAETKTFKKLVEPKFKVGDKIVNILMKYMVAPGSKGKISEITDDKYIFTDSSYISISDQDSWELVSNKKPKFDPKTLKPFDKVLVRRNSENYNVWFPDFVSYPPDATNNKTLCMCVMEDIAMVIPYNDETKHLAGTTDEAPEFYRYWED